MVVTHEPWIVVLSVLVAVQGAYVGLKLALELPGSSGARRRLLLAGAAVTLAVAIWSMHFVAMLAVRSPVRIEYLVLPTLLSFLVCVVVVGLAVFLASSAPASKPVLALSATVMGAGIVTMHFIGMNVFLEEANLARVGLKAIVAVQRRDDLLADVEELRFEADEHSRERDRPGLLIDHAPTPILESLGGGEHD